MGKLTQGGGRTIPDVVDRLAQEAAKRLSSQSNPQARVVKPTPSTYTPTLQRWSNAKLAMRALMAVVVLALFYVFSLAVVAALLFVTWLQVQFFNHPGGGAILWLVIVPPLAALSIVIAIWPRFHTWSHPGRGLTEKRAPELFAMLREVSRATHQQMPRRVYLVNEVHAFAARRGVFMGRAMIIGLPLFELLTVGELRAVVAHEFGHFASRVGLSTFVYQAVVTFAGATAASSLVPGLDVAFELWTEVFLRIAMPISRQQELRADELAVRVAGAETAISALTKISGNSAWGEIADPMPGWEQDLHETHPPLRDRIALARRVQLSGALPVDDRPARVLLESLLPTGR